MLFYRLSAIVVDAIIISLLVLIYLPTSVMHSAFIDKYVCMQVRVQVRITMLIMVLYWIFCKTYV